MDNKAFEAKLAAEHQAKLNAQNLGDVTALGDTFRNLAEALYSVELSATASDIDTAHFYYDVACKTYDQITWSDMPEFLSTMLCNRIMRARKSLDRFDTAATVLIHVEDADEVYFYTDHVHVQLSYDHKYVNLTDGEFHAMQDGGCVEVDSSRIRTIPR